MARGIPDPPLSPDHKPPDPPLGRGPSQTGVSSARGQTRARAPASAAASGKGAKARTCHEAEGVPQHIQLLIRQRAGGCLHLPNFLVPRVGTQLADSNELLPQHLVGLCQVDAWELKGVDAWMQQ